jgi:SAM-dependent methyltransferase
VRQFKSNQALFSFSGPEDHKRLRDVFSAAGYTDAGILEALGVKDVGAIQAGDLPQLLHRTNRGTPLDTLIRLFLIEVPCAPETVRLAIRPMTLDAWLDAGLITMDCESVAAAVQLLPYRNLLLAFDLPGMRQSAMAKNYVMGIGSSTLTLANLTVRRSSRLTLDLGSGCGIQAFLAAPHSDRVLAVDRNPRAVRFAAFNAKLNGFANVECLEGDFFAPVRGHRFDLVVTNPPFVISPETRYVYRDGGLPADQVCQKIVREVPPLLNEGGFCQILCNWVETDGQDWHQRLRAWFKGTGCDAWILRSETRDAQTYATTWIRHTERDAPEQYAKRFEKWTAYYQQKKIAAVSAGLITMRRASGRPNWFRAEDGPEKMLGACGPYIARGFGLRDFLETVQDDSTLLNTCLRASLDIHLDRRFAPSPEGWAEVGTQLHLTRGLAFTGNIDSYVAKMVMACNGRRRLTDLLGDMAVALGRDPAEISPHFCHLVRGLIERGFLLPPGFEE